MRSSSSPAPYRSQGQPVFDYPSPAHSDSHFTLKYTAPPQGLGVYGCRMSESFSDSEESMTAMTAMPSSDTATNWPTPALHSRRTSQPSPNALSSEYDPFAPLHSGIPSSYSNAIYYSQPIPTSLSSISPALSCVESSRSSVSSAATSDSYSHPHDSYHAFQPRIKMEEHLDWPAEPNHSMLMSSSQADCSILATSASAFPICFDNSFYAQGNLGWPKAGTTGDEVGFSGSLNRSSMNDTAPQNFSEQRKSLSSATRTRTPRKMTTREDANFQCRVKGCGKLFSRSYNYKAHMETHDASRIYPFPCPLSECNKKFVRKTDLQRHHQSVHMKERNYQCDFCSRNFARKDTLRR
jgi:hypothetical protein